MTNQLKTETLILCKGTSCGWCSHTWALDASLGLLYENLKTITGTFAYVNIFSIMAEGLYVVTLKTSVQVTLYPSGKGGDLVRCLSGV
jgi:hypothetical protein